MERYLSDETNLFSYANKLKEFERKDFHWFSVLDGTEIEPQTHQDIENLREDDCYKRQLDSEGVQRRNELFDKMR
nr:6721_t:CDS:2 [Entrophospora candida]